MKIAAIGDIHGNSAALSAVLDDIRAQEVDTIVNVGDYFSGPLDAAGTAELLLRHSMVCIRGNHDRYLLEIPPDKMHASDRVAHAQLRADHLQWLASLPATAVYDALFLCHGTPRDDEQYWLQQVTADGQVVQTPRHDVEARAQGIEQQVIVCGHTHLAAIVRLADGRMLVNPGSVGCPAYDDTAPVYHVMQTGTPDACYALLEVHAGQWRASLRHVPYDATEMVAMARSEGREDWALALESGWIMPAN